MLYSPSLKNVEILRGVRYRKGSIKLLEADNLFIVEIKHYFLFRITYYIKRMKFNTLEEAEQTYDRIQSYFYRIS
ncbi:MAG: hypothetical protein HY965_05115 [Ignavibacteriales bacterium]|nr:hypothetical protein [Ignavibacteriales bacterium]